MPSVAQLQVLETSPAKYVYVAPHALGRFIDRTCRAAPLLDQRFATLKKSLVASENKAKVIESYQRLCDVLQKEAELIAQAGPAIVPEIDFNDVCRNGNNPFFPACFPSRCAIQIY